MKTQLINTLAGLMTVIGLASCAKPLPMPDLDAPYGNEPLVSVKFSTDDGKAATRLTGMDARNEVKVNRWALFVFDRASEWYAYGTSVEADEEIVIQLRAGRIYDAYALVNYPVTGTGALNPSGITAASELTEKVAALSDNSPDNLVMFGAISVMPSPNVTESKLVHVSRLVSRLDVTQVAVDFSEKPYLAAKTFTLRRIYVTNAYRTARYGSDYTFPELSSARSAWYNSAGFHRGEVGEPACDALLADLNLNVPLVTGPPYQVSHSFYVFPNITSKNDDDRQLDVWTRRCTRIILECTLDDKTMYYPVDVPDMVRNRIYSVSDIVIKGHGSNDPEVIDVDPESIEVSYTVSSSEWTGDYYVSENS